MFVCLSVCLSDCVDDNLQIDKIFMENACPTGENRRDKHAIPTQNLFRRITSKAESRGMVVNASKTAMMCISDATSYRAEAHIFANDGSRIETGVLEGAWLPPVY